MNGAKTTLITGATWPAGILTLRFGASILQGATAKLTIFPTGGGATVLAEQLAVEGEGIYRLILEESTSHDLLIECPNCSWTIDASFLAY